jgi:glycosyltransferase involved in cell wall biosynthesis
MNRQLRIAIIASARYPIRQPFAGGLEAQTWSLAVGLRERGHQVTLFAGSEGDPLSEVAEVHSRWPTISDAAKADSSMPPLAWLEEHHAYLRVMLELAGSGLGRFDVIHNNSLHHLPVAMASAVAVPMVTTLHTPPIPWLESAIQLGPCPVTFVAVSRHTAQAWQHALASVKVIPNGVDLDRWQFGAGGRSLIWFGRLVPEKGPELAIQAARLARLPLDLVGPVSNHRYFTEQVEPLLGDGVRYVGHLEHEGLARLVARSAACLVTPRWDEPYGLVAAEALACGTPVAGFARGALPEVLDDTCGVLVEADDVAALATAAQQAALLPRTAARRRAVGHCSVTAMLDGYERLYQKLAVPVMA